MCDDFYLINKLTTEYVMRLSFNKKKINSSI